MKFPTLSLAVLATPLLTLALSGSVQAAEPDEPRFQSYSLDFEARLTTDRRTNGLSDTYRRPGADFTVNAAHESGLVGFLQLGTVARESFPKGNRSTVLVGAGYRWGHSEGWHFGLGLAQEMFPNAEVEAPRNAFIDPTDTVKTRFDTTFGVLEFGYGIIEARYLLVTSRDFRGNNTAVVCGSALQVGSLEGDVTEAMNCYDRGFQHSRGSQLLQVETRLPLTGSTQLLAHVGYTHVRHFDFLNTWDYRVGLIHKRWGFDFEADVVGGLMDNDYYAKTVNTAGTSIRRIDRPALVLSVARKF